MSETREIQNLEDVDEQAVSKYVTGSSTSGMYALGTMSDAEFEQRLAAVQRAEERTLKIFNTLTEGKTEEFDLMRYEGMGDDKKPFLTQNGALRVCSFFGIAAIAQPERVVRGGEDEPPYTVYVDTKFHIGDANGPVIMTATGVASSWEKKYKYVTQKPLCPDCGFDLRISRHDKEYYCWQKIGGCGEKWPLDHSGIDKNKQILDPDPEDRLETLVRMAHKRGLVAGARYATNVVRYTSIDPEAHGVIVEAEWSKSDSGKTEEKPASGAPPQSAPSRQAPAPEPAKKKTTTRKRTTKKTEAKKAAAKRADTKPNGRWLPDKDCHDYVDRLLDNSHLILASANTDAARNARLKKIEEAKKSTPQWLSRPDNLNPSQWWKAIENLRKRILNNGGNVEEPPQGVKSLSILALQE